MIRKLFITCIFTFFAVSSLFSQRPGTPYQIYIDQYAPLAQEQMQKYKIPASITLAQALLESDAGRSTLARTANNHFGIKTPGGWTGPYVLRDDDRPNERFRKYERVKDSYEDHSLFLLKPRYAVLFQYDILDYRSWAHGLKNCGYATNPAYAQSLISIIENWKLAQYDTHTSLHVNNQSDFFDLHAVGRCNKNYYIVVRQGDTLKQIAEGTGVSRRKLLRYNDLPSNYEVKPGDIIFLQKKRRKADKSMYGVVHVVTPGQSLYDISQLYGMRLESLYKLNHFDYDHVPQAGDFMRVY